MISSYLPDLPCVSVCVCMCVYVCVCVCVDERERGGEGVREGESVCVQQMWLCVDVLMYIYTESEGSICVIIFITLILPSPSCFHKALTAFRDRCLKITFIIISIISWHLSEGLAALCWVLAICWLCTFLTATGVIVTDTINFSPAAGKTTPKDLELAERLEEVIGDGVDRDSVFQEIKEAKFDLSGINDDGDDYDGC